MIVHNEQAGDLVSCYYKMPCDSLDRDRPAYYQPLINHRRHAFLTRLISLAQACGKSIGRRPPANFLLLHAKPEHSGARHGHNGNVGLGNTRVVTQKYQRILVKLTLLFNPFTRAGRRLYQDV